MNVESNPGFTGGQGGRRSPGGKAESVLRRPRSRHPRSREQAGCVGCHLRAGYLHLGSDRPFVSW